MPEYLHSEFIATLQAAALLSRTTEVYYNTKMKEAERALASTVEAFGAAATSYSLLFGIIA